MDDRKQKILDLLEKSGKSIPKIAGLVGINYGTLYNYLQGKTAISIENYDKVLDYLTKLVQENKSDR